MDGNELEECLHCKQTISDNDQWYPCDLCTIRVHKNCKIIFIGSKMHAIAEENVAVLMQCLQKFYDPNAYIF